MLSWFVSSFTVLSQLDCAGIRKLECGCEQGSWSSRWVFSSDGVDSVTRYRGWCSTVDGASAFMNFNGIATSLCIISCVSPLHKRNPATCVDDEHYRALMDIDISFFSTSMIGFECIWTGVFTTLQMGMFYDYLFAPFRVVSDVVGIDSGEYLCHLERTSRVL